MALTLVKDSVVPTGPKGLEGMFWDESEDVFTIVLLLGFPESSARTYGKADTTRLGEHPREGFPKWFPRSMERKLGGTLGAVETGSRLLPGATGFWRPATARQTPLLPLRQTGPPV